MIVIAIIAILATLAAAPYSYFSDKQRVRTQVARFEQLVSQAKSEASNGFIMKCTSWVVGCKEEAANIALEINPNSGSSAPTVNYIRYRPSDTTVDAYKCTIVWTNDCTKTAITLVDQRIKIADIHVGTTLIPLTTVGYILFDAPNGFGSQKFDPTLWNAKNDVKLLIQLGEDSTLTKTVILSPR